MKLAPFAALMFVASCGHGADMRNAFDTGFKMGTVKGNRQCYDSLHNFGAMEK